MRSNRVSKRTNEENAMKTTNFSIKLLISFACIFFLTSICLAQNVARYYSDNSIEFRLDSVPKDKKDKIKKALLFDSAKDKASIVDVNRINLPTSGDWFSVDLDSTEAPINIKTFPVTITFIIQPKQEEDKREVITVQVALSGTIGTAELKKDVADGRDDANVYVSGNAEVARKQKPDFKLDVKLEREISLSDKTAFYITPFVDFKATNDTEASDKFSGGAKFIARAPRKHIQYSFSGELETDFKWKVINLISRQELKYLFKPIHFKEEKTIKAILLPKLFIGGEFGSNLRSPLQRDERGIARLLAGASLEFKLFEPFEKTSFLNKLNIKKLIWENKFEQRWFLTKEQSYDKEDGKLILKEFGRKPRDYFSSNLHFKFNDFWGPTLSYEWGQLPPLYNKVNHNLKVGLTYSFSVTPK
jgi:hypothetical protein